MKNVKMWKALFAVCAVVLLAAYAVNALPFARAEQYSVGDAEIRAAVRNLDIDWTSGQIHIAYHSGNTVLISEKITGEVSRDMRMRWRVDGDTLRIEYEKPGFRLLSILPHEKELTVTLPEGITLEKADISSTSGDMDIPALYADSIELKSTSGDIHAAVHARSVKADLTSGDLTLRVLSGTEEIRIDSTSGDVTLDAAGTNGKTVIDTTSGAIRATVQQAEEFKATSTSGAVYCAIGWAKKAEIKSTSGNVIAEIAGMEALDIHTTSGSVTACLPVAPGFTARIETTGGQFESRLPLAKQGKDYIAGDGSASVKIHTTSGDIVIEPKEN